ncbi:hypothetical protein NEOLEDRAFT_1245327 [Neolentinus lepideus HHB14362 ss-1]|uniref:DNA endonuclease activator Ctp1 C-terminal domain-containing protein n=1 Tax=Neolentinus lepideus HHB14362 ss-1 TaxID=1314782 RepID=A0A165NXQ2_9AGAM|nr:hypothetical protein NEOLEDRAFT_1245327 [Neolentinus lepideus HHB14362 ss-1]
MQAQEIKRLEYLLKQSEEKNNKVTWHNDQLRKDLFNAKQRNNNLATAFGFDDALDAEYAIASGELHDRLCHYFGWADPSQPEQDEALQSRVAALEQELKQLQDRYDALLGAKEKVTARYRSDYKKWKNFKEWLFEDKKKAMHFIKKEKEKRKRKDNEGKGDDRGGGSSPRKEAPAGLSDSPNKTLVNPLNLKRDDAEDLDDLSDTSSVTEDDSQAPLPTPSFDINAYLLSDIAKSINKKKRRISDIADADCSTPLSLEKDFRPSPKKEGSPAKRESPRKQRTPTKRLTSTPTKQCSEEREKENTPSQGKSISPTAGPSIITSKTSSKGKVTNAILGDADTSINALYEIDPARNGGVVFPFSSVVRSKEHRKHLKGGDCECCRDVRVSLMHRVAHGID